MSGSRSEPPAALKSLPMETSYQSGVKFAAYPSTDMQTSLNQWIGCQRVIYNAKTDEDRYSRTFQRKTLDLVGESTPLDQQYSQFKSELAPWLSEVPSQILRNGATRWMTAKQRQLKGLGGAPVRKRAFGRQSVLITKELFEFEPIQPNNLEAGYRLVLGTKKFPLGELRFVAHRPYKIPNQIVISHKAGKLFVSFSYVVKLDETDAPIRTPKELAYEFNLLSDEALASMMNRYDRGVVLPVADAYGAYHCPEPVVEERIERRKTHVKHYQRQLARQVKGSCNGKKTKAKIAKASDYRARCTEDWAHKTSHALVTTEHDGVVQMIHVFENLKIQNMVGRPKAKMVDGKWVRNGAAAKAGLNTAILKSGWGRVVLYTRYKGGRRNQLVLLVPPHHSSQECSACGHTHPDNRLEQAEFICQRCGHAENTDTNASKVLKKRGLAALRKGPAIPDKPVVKVSMRKNKEKNSGTGEGFPVVSVERPNKTFTGTTSIAHAAMKQKISTSDGRSTVL